MGGHGFHDLGAGGSSRSDCNDVALGQKGIVEQQLNDTVVAVVEKPVDFVAVVSSCGLSAYSQRQGEVLVVVECFGEFALVDSRQEKKTADGLQVHLIGELLEFCELNAREFIEDGWGQGQLRHHASSGSVSLFCRLENKIQNGEQEWITQLAEGVAQHAGTHRALSHAFEQLEKGSGALGSAAVLPFFQ